MKIFNWVHRKFNSKDGPNIGNVKKKAEQHDTQALLEQAALADVIDTWKQGILTIGTFGFDPLKDFTAQQKEIQLIITNEEEEEEEEEDPLVLNAFKHGFNNGICSDIHAQSEITLASDDDHEYKKKERITLADLFSADSDHHMDTKPTHHEHHKLLQPELGVSIKIKIKIKIKPEEEPAAHAKPKLPFAKKLIPPLLKDFDSHSHLHPHPRPIKKMHRMMTRILKRKIHPELEGKNKTRKIIVKILEPMKHFLFFKVKMPLLARDQHLFLI